MTLLILLLIIAALYVLSYVLFTVWGLGSIAWGSRAKPNIALTFDDGPSPLTPRILELLRQHDFKATFFLTLKQCQKFPQYLEAIKADGHQIEAHGVWHRPAVLMMPWTEWVQINKSPGKLYRPPWGLHSPFTRMLARQAGKQIVLWDTESKDWLELSPQQIYERLIFYTRPGSILLLHDRFERTLPALEMLLPKLKELGYKPVRLDELETKALGLRGAIIRALQGGEEKFNREHKVWRTGYKPFSIFRLEKTPFPGPAVEGVPVRAFGYHLHLESARLSEAGPVQLLRVFRESLKEVARDMEKDPEAQIIFGYSYLSQAGKVVGFSSAPIPTKERLISTVASAWFRWLYRGELPKRERIEAELTYMTREVLLSKYGSSKSSPIPSPLAGEGTEG